MMRVSFDTPDSHSFWQPVNDGVMGGRSSGGPRFEDDRMIFQGVINTNGGGLSCVHPGMYGLFCLIEAATQIRGDGGKRQIDDVNIAIAHGNGGTFSNEYTAVLGSEAAL